MLVKNSLLAVGTEKLNLTSLLQTHRTLSIYEICEINEITNIMKYQTKVPYIANYSVFFKNICGYVFEDLKQQPHIGIAWHMFPC